MRLALVAVVTSAVVALAGESPAAAKDDKALTIQNGKGAKAKK